MKFKFGDKVVWKGKECLYIDTVMGHSNLAILLYPSDKVIKRINGTVGQWGFWFFETTDSKSYYGLHVPLNEVKKVKRE